MTIKRQQPIVMIVWVVSLVVLAIAYGLALFPQQRQLQRLQQDAVTLNDTLESLQQLSSPLVRQRYQDRFEQAKGQTENLVFDSEQLSKFDFKVREMASAAEMVQFNSRNQFNQPIGSTDTPQALSQQQISMSAKCDFPGFLQFVNALERHHPAPYITGFKLSQNFEKANEPLASAILDVSLWCDK